MSAQGQYEAELQNVHSQLSAALARLSAAEREISRLRQENADLRRQINDLPVLNDEANDHVVHFARPDPRNGVIGADAVEADRRVWELQAQRYGGSLLPTPSNRNFEYEARQVRDERLAREGVNNPWNEK